MIENTRDRILLTAFRHFFAKGYKEVTMNDLVRATGLSKGAFYHYFSSKEELYELTMEKHLLSYLQSLKLEHDHSLSLRDNIKKIFGRFTNLASGIREIIEDTPYGLTEYFLFLQEALKNDEFRVKFDQFSNSFHTELTHWVKVAIDHGELKQDLDPDVFASHLGSLIKGVSALYTAGQSLDLRPETFNRIIDQLFSLIENKNHERFQISEQNANS